MRCAMTETTEPDEATRAKQTVIAAHGSEGKGDSRQLAAHQYFVFVF